jgi:hypothetical protein
MKKSINLGTKYVYDLIKAKPTQRSLLKLALQGRHQ